MENKDNYVIEYNDLKFYPLNNKIHCIFMDYFDFDIYIDNLKDLLLTKQIVFNRHSIILKNSKYKNKILRGIDKGLNNLNCLIDHKQTIYIYDGLGIPLIGHNAFGIVDMDTNWIEIKPITVCNFNCIFCSVAPKYRSYNFVVSEEYLIKELFKLISLKREKINIFINAQGEPLFYSPMDQLIRDLRKNKKIGHIVLVTNGSLLTQTMFDSLIKSGLNQINISIHSLNKDKASYLANFRFDVEKLINLVLRNKDKIKIVFTPVYLKSINDADIEELVKFCKKNNIEIQIQNYLRYKFGNKPIKPIGMGEFYSFLTKLQEKYNIELLNKSNNLSIVRDKVLENPFKKGEIIRLKPIIHGRFYNEAISCLRNRTISIILKKSYNPKRFIKARVIRIKHNIIGAVEI